MNVRIKGKTKRKLREKAKRSIVIMIKKLTKKKKADKFVNSSR